MREPIGRWGHLGVFTNGAGSLTWTNDLGAYREWHERQLQDALQIANERFVDALHMIPKDGFYVFAGRSTFRDLFTRVSIEEEVDQLTCPKSYKPMGQVAGVARRQPISVLGTGENIFPDLFSELAELLPQNWQARLEWRLSKHWKPVPEWLLTLRAEQRKAKLRLRGATATGKKPAETKEPPHRL